MQNEIKAGSQANQLKITKPNDTEMMNEESIQTNVHLEKHQTQIINNFYQDPSIIDQKIKEQKCKINTKLW